jgi:hypothetical protein
MSAHVDLRRELPVVGSWSDQSNGNATNVSGGVTAATR